MARSAGNQTNCVLERQVERTITARRIAEGRRGALEDREFARLLELLAPRIRYLIRAYRLGDMVEDAEQACAIGVFRALDSYESTQAQFSTHVTWQLRGELQSLRHRVRLDQRRSARSAGIRTVELERLTAAHPGTFEIVDDEARIRTETAASDAMAIGLLDRLLDQLGSPEHEREILLAQLLDREPPARSLGYTNEQRRQITRRTYRNCAKIVGGKGMIGQ